MPSPPPSVSPYPYPSYVGYIVAHSNLVLTKEVSFPCSRRWAATVVWEDLGILSTPNHRVNTKVGVGTKPFARKCATGMTF